MAKVLNMEAMLPLFMPLAASSPFEYSEWDCAMTLANWWNFLLGVDPAAELRGTYHDNNGWRRIVRQSGGFHSLVGRLAENVGGHKVDNPLLGDIGVVKTPTGPAGGIWTGNYWVSKSLTGMSAGRANAHGVWSLR